MVNCCCTKTTEHVDGTIKELYVENERPNFGVKC